MSKVARYDTDNGEEDRIAKTAASLRTVVTKAGVELALAVGRLIVEGLYDGDVRAWHERGPKDGALRRLALHPDVPMGATALYRSLALYELSENLGGLHRWPTLGISHFRVVRMLPVPDQIEVLNSAAAQGWTVRRLETEARSRGDATRRRGGRPRKSSIARVVSKLGREANEIDMKIIDDVDVIDPREADALATALSAVRQSVDQLHGLLRRRAEENGAEAAVGNGSAGAGEPDPE